MKAFLLAILLVVGLDEAFDHGAGVKACVTLIVDLVRGTRHEVGDSVYRR